ncbi:TetR family transcriptional regulator [Asanoa ishikariensis]|uniref:Transcriptional regulator, TetR family n=1 Tax=Asanoa ishikariensis TaxID=137265 RepID=A0A1H3UEE8_9ACTN|nr:TetR/AcrR family transcriptional regulator C-terminal domain-containing protein [Asanoa ishikariensis]GIF63755.1 TetR family transcriptional regulator [Asanoa ishikariensis]SDZ60657.1 transcriptional regulator, TetR family [Asanoa ishikariensis]
MTAKTFREPLSRERVLAAAVSLVDSEGIKALTMRRLASELGVEAMSLYFYVAGKEELLDGVISTVLDEIVETSTQQTDWRAHLREQFLAARQVMLRHPWAPGLLTTRRTIPGGVYAYFDRIVGTLLRAGFSHHLAHRAIHAFGSMPFGFAQEVFSPAAAGGSLEPDDAEADLAAMAEALPNLTAMVAHEMHGATDPTLGWCDSQVEFEFTLDLLLDGLERYRAASTSDNIAG